MIRLQVYGKVLVGKAFKSFLSGVEGRPEAVTNARDLDFTAGSFEERSFCYFPGDAKAGGYCVTMRRTFPWSPSMTVVIEWCPEKTTRTFILFPWQAAYRRLRHTWSRLEAAGAVTRNRNLHIHFQARQAQPTRERVAVLSVVPSKTA